MSRVTRREFLKLSAAAGAGAGLSALGCAGSPATPAKPSKAAGKVVVIGGGFGGVTAAKYIRRAAPGVEVTLIEPKTSYITCPFSNLVLGGLKTMDAITHRYDKLSAKHGVKVVHDLVTAIDPAKKTVKLKKGQTLAYDRLVVAPGIDFKWGAIQGYDERAAALVPHAYQAGPQTLLLQKQLKAMRNGGVVIIAPPGNPFRCPPGPYERASMIAHFLKTNKPKSKILILDAKNDFSKQGLFMDGWKALYPGMIEWTGNVQLTRIDARTRTLYTEMDKHKGDVVNLIPAQKAGAIAHTAGLTNDSGWCPVNPATFESTVHKGVHVIGDSSIAGAMPKSGFSANSQAKAAAAAIVHALGGAAAGETAFVNTCYSLVGPGYGISVANVYRIKDGKIDVVKDADGKVIGGVSPKDAPAEIRQKEATFTEGWYQSITADMFG